MILGEESIFVPVPTKTVISQVVRIQRWVRCLSQRAQDRVHVIEFLDKKRRLELYVVLIQRAVRAHLKKTRLLRSPYLPPAPPPSVDDEPVPDYSEQVRQIQRWWRTQIRTRKPMEQEGSGSDPISKGDSSDYNYLLSRGI
jgi:hypothetical protein